MLLIKNMGSKSRSSSANRHNFSFFSSITLYICFLTLYCIFDTVLCDYENTWNFYYEQPCCGSSTGYNSHHVRHHRGKFSSSSSFSIALPSQSTEVDDIDENLI